LGLIEEIEIMNKKIDRQLGRIEKENEWFKNWFCNANNKWI
jgi:hypothetical protein